jgi:hypothetical protein
MTFFKTTIEMYSITAKDFELTRKIKLITINSKFIFNYRNFPLNICYCLVQYYRIKVLWHGVRITLQYIATSYF